MAARGFWATLTSKIFLLMALLALGAIGFGVVRSAVKRAEVESEISALKDEIRAHEAKNEELARLISYLGTDEFKEREARLRLGLQKPGETVVVIPGLEESLSQASQQVDNVTTTGMPNWLIWWQYFFGTSHDT